MKKVITVPQDVQLQDPISGTVSMTVSFRKLLRETFLADQAFVANYDMICAAARIDAAFVDATVGSKVTLDLSDHEKLVKVVKTPSGGRYLQNTLPMIQLLPHLDAIIGAADQT